MRILCATQNDDGSYNQPFDWPGGSPPNGHYKIADGVDETPLTSNGGFAALTLNSNNIITVFTANSVAWAAWQSAHPTTTQEPTVEEQLRADVDYIAVMTGVTL